MDDLQDLIEKYNKFISKVEYPDNFIFMNYGFADLDYNGTLLKKKPLNPLHNFWYYQSNFYIYLLSLKNISTGDILDISCGRGGGVSVYKEYYNFNRIVGLDIHPNNIKFAQQKFKGIEFIEGNALSLPFNNESFNIVTNVEAFGYYIDQHDTYFKEVSRILKPKGVFLLAQYYQYSPNFNFEKYNLKILHEVDISENVKYALNSNFYEFSKYPFLQQITKVGLEIFPNNIYKIIVCQKYGV